MNDLDALQIPGGLNMSNLVEFPESLRQLITWMMREGDVEAEELAAYLSLDIDRARQLLDALLGKGLVEEVNELQEERYHVVITTARNYRVPKKIWEVFDNE
jgi:DNA-binding MarR family transcriptional regulator